MPTFLFDKIIFGPVASRRLGNSLGINLLPADKKICNFDCIYCECGLTDSPKGILPSRTDVSTALEKTLQEFKALNKTIDTITFAGNGEPTLHKEFEGIIQDTWLLRNTYFPTAKIALLTNATTLSGKNIRKAYEKIDLNILKLDSAFEETVKLINCPIGNYNLERTVRFMRDLKNPIIQTMFIRGTYKSRIIDNTTEKEVTAWLDMIKFIRPSMVMIYTIARDTPFDTLEKASPAQLEKIADRVRELGIEVQISA